MAKPRPICEIDFRPMTVYRGRKCENEPPRWKDGLDFAVKKLRDELTQIEVLDAVVETYHSREDYTISGWPRSGIKPSRPEVQVWFRIGERPVCVPSARFKDWVDNIKAVAMTLERQRLIRDYGCFTIEEQFAAFTALPPGGTTAAMQAGSVATCAALILNLAQPTDDKLDRVMTDQAVLDRVYKRASMKAHPDKGGSAELQAKVNQAREEIERANGWKR